MLPQMYAFFWNILKSVNILIVLVSQEGFEKVYNLAVQYLQRYLQGDSFAAEYLLLHLLSKTYNFLYSCFVHFI